MKQYFKILIALCIVTGVGYLWVHSFSGKPQDTPIQQAVVGTLVNSQAQDSETREENIQPAQSEEDRQPPSISEVTPSVETIRNEVEQNPHGTPPSVLDFATEIAPRMEAALQSESEATSLFEELKECSKAADSTTPLSVKAICLSNANILKQSFPSLEGEFNTLFNSIPEEVQKLVEVQ